MKRFISLFLSLLMVFSVCSTGVGAVVYEEKLTKYPVVMVAGFMGSDLIMTNEQTGEDEVAWSWDAVLGKISGASSGSLHNIILEFGEYLLAGNVDPIAKRLGEGFNRIFIDLKSNPDGSSYNETVRPVVEGAEQTNYAYLQQTYPDGKHQLEYEIMTDVCNKVGAENCYAFHKDFRSGALDAAYELRNYIDQVIEHNNKGRAEDEKIDKVNLVAVSHGGQIAGTYLALYGNEGKVNKAVLTVPALGGAGIAYDAFNSGNVTPSFGEVLLLEFIQHAMLMEEDFHYLLECGLLEFLDELLAALVYYCMDTIGCWGSLWDFIPVEYYDQLKSELLDEELNSVLIEKSDFVHYEVMSEDGEYYYGKTFKALQELGVDIYIMAGYDIQIITGMGVSSDAIIHTSGATGATCAPFGERFSDGYTQKVDTGFYQVSPSMTVDASTCYLPEHTWLVQEYYHGMTYKDEYTRELLMTLLLNDESYDVHSFEEYPQFHATTNLAHGVYAAFDSSADGFVGAQDSALVITNISGENNIFVSAVTVRGCEGISFPVVPFTLKPGESREIEIKGELPEISLANIEIDVSYLISTYTPIGQRTFDFTIMNGPAVEYDASKPYTDADYPSAIDKELSKDTTDLLEKYGVKGIVSVIYNIVSAIRKFIEGIISFFKG